MKPRTAQMTALYWSSITALLANLLKEFANQGLVFWLMAQKFVQRPVKQRTSLLSISASTASELLLIISVSALTLILTIRISAVIARITTLCLMV